MTDDVRQQGEADTRAAQTHTQQNTRTDTSSAGSSGSGHGRSDGRSGSGSSTGPAAVTGGAREAEAEAEAGLRQVRQQEMQRRRNPDMPRTAEVDEEEIRMEPGQWSALADVPVWECAVAEGTVLSEVPVTQRGRWQRAYVDVHDEVYQGERHRAHGGALEAVSTALKWYLVLPQLLLEGPRARGSTRSRARTTAEVSRRLDLWERGQRRQLVLEWVRRREERRARAGRGQWITQQARDAGADRAAEMEAALEAAMSAIRDGQMQKGLNLLHTDGLAPLQCTRQAAVGDWECNCEGCANLRQAKDRTPLRRGVMPVPEEFPSGERIQLSCRKRMLALRKHKGMGLSKMRDDHIRALAKPSGEGCEKAKRAVEVVDALGDAYMNGEMPVWFYAVFTAVRCVALKKPTGGVRPLGVGECLRKLWWAEATDMMASTFRQAVFPRQMAVGAPAAGQSIVMTVRTVLEVHPEWGVVKLDIRNYFNEMSRARMMEVTAAVPGLRCLVPALYAELAVDSRIHMGGAIGWAHFRSEEGGQQGHPVIPAVSALYLLQAQTEAMSVLQRGDKDAVSLGQMDDAYLVGPVEALREAVQVFKTSIEQPDTDLELVVTKTTTWSPSEETRRVISRW